MIQDDFIHTQRLADMHTYKQLEMLETPNHRLNIAHALKGQSKKFEVP